MTRDRTISLRTGDPASTRALGRGIGEVAGPGWVVLLDGPLGAGKTVLAQGLLAGAGVGGRVRSPTFTLVNHYQGRLPVWHADLYRLNGEEEFRAVGGDELLPAVDGLTVVEWAERLGSLRPAEHIQISLGFVPARPPDDRRLIRVELHGERYQPAALAIGAGGDDR